MKHFLLFCCFISTTIVSSAQVFNFYGSEYFLSADSNTTAGTALTTSGTNLSGFDYSSAPADHPLFTQGIYYAVQDCGNRNLWVRLQHIAADPNGTENGANIDQTLNTPFYPPGSTDRIGGFNGFLYDIRIFGDQNINGTRANVLGGPFFTNITVESLETLFNDGGFQFEWLSFLILNTETSGWSLNSINFTGINPNSSPGFSSELHYANTGTPDSAPIGFSTEFPEGSPVVYAVDMNLSGQQHSEFRMSASSVSHFRYGYEFNSGGYQGMSMAFGGNPVINSTVNNPLCAGSDDGSILIEATGTQPLTYSWDTGDQTAALDNVAAGNYLVTVTDPSGCFSSASFSVVEPAGLVVTISEEGETPHLMANVSGGTGNYSYLWNTGSTDIFIDNPGTGNYSVVVTDENGCSATAVFTFVGLVEIPVNTVRVFPNPVIGDYLFLNAGALTSEFRLFNVVGQTVRQCLLTHDSTETISVSGLSKGVYFYSVTGNDLFPKKGTVIIE